jgi:hypothetical protein
LLTAASAQISLVSTVSLWHTSASAAITSFASGGRGFRPARGSRRDANARVGVWRGTGMYDAGRHHGEQHHVAMRILSVVQAAYRPWSKTLRLRSGERARHSRINVLVGILR